MAKKIGGLSPEQAKALLKWHLVHERTSIWPTYSALLDLGYLEEIGTQLVVTAKGKAWCDEHHLEVAL